MTAPMREVDSLLSGPTGQDSSPVTRLPEAEAESPSSIPLRCVFSVDVEDWYHILDVPSAPPMSEWDRLPSRVEENLVKLLDVFAEKGVLTTCFFVGWIAEKYPHLVKEAQGRGHEVASHGYAHKLVYEMTPTEFLQDAVRSRRILEDLLGQPVVGYRASGFSVTPKTPWFFDVLIEAGYQYDSSVFPARRGHGGLEGSGYAPYLATRGGKSLVEFPISVKEILRLRVCFFGGGYLRIFPYALIRRMARSVLKEGRPVVFYVHPREIDPTHPRLPMAAHRKFKSYINLDSTEQKIRRLISDFDFVTFQSLLAKNERLLDG